MFKNYLTVAFRNLFKGSGKDRNLFSIINLTGLAIGLAATFLIAGYVSYEFSYDRFVPDADQVYRIAVEKTEQGETTFHSAKTYPGLYHMLPEEVPDISSVVRILAEDCMFHEKEKDRKFNRQVTYWADGTFPEMFGLSFIEEGELSLLYEPNQAIVSKTAAERFFGTDWSGKNNPIGKTVYLNESIPFTIQGIFEDLPKNSHMKVDFIVSYQTLVMLVGDGIDTGMPPHWNVNYTYIKTIEGASRDRTENLINKAVIAKIPKESLDGATLELQLQPVRSIHLNSHLADELNPNGSSFFVWAMAAAAGMILIIAWINFINLTTVRSMDRAREVGVRKSLGAGREQLAMQFLSETVLAGLTAALIAVVLIFLVVNTFTDKTGIELSLFSKESIRIWTIFISMTVFGALIAGLYPAVILSSFKPVRVLKGKLYNYGRGGFFRKGLIVFQLGIAMILLFSTTVVYKQVNYMLDQDLGMDTDQVLVVYTPRSLIGNPERVEIFKEFKTTVKEHRNIEEAAASMVIPGKEFLYHVEGIHPVGESTGEHMTFDLASVEEGFLPALGIEVVWGRNFMEDGYENDKLILNEKASQVLGFSDPEEALGTKVDVLGGEYTVVGVTRNYHHEDLQKDISPILLRYGHDYEFGYFPIKITGDVRETVEHVNEVWARVYPNDPFDYFFLDSFFDAQYQSDLAFGKVFGFFTGLAIFVALLGLFGLITFTVYQKTKEIGIRKVLGATGNDINSLILRSYSWLYLIAAMLSLPAAYYVVSQWLSTFAYRIDLNWAWYLMSVAVVISLSLLAVSKQIVKAVRANPVDAIKEE